MSMEVSPLHILARHVPQIGTHMSRSWYVSVLRSFGIFLEDLIIHLT